MTMTSSHPPGIDPNTTLACPDCPSDVRLLVEDGQLVCRACGRVFPDAIYPPKETYRDADQLWNGLPAEEVQVLRHASGRAINLAGLGVETGAKDERKRKEDKAIQQLIATLVGSPLTFNLKHLAPRAQALYTTAQAKRRVRKAEADANGERSNPRHWARWTTASCVLLAVKESGRKASVHDVARWAQLEPKELGREVKRVAKLLGMQSCLDTTIDDRIDEVLAHLQRVVEDPAARLSKAPWKPASTAWLEAAEKRRADLPDLCQSVLRLASGITLFNARSPDSPALAVVFMALQAAAGTYLYRAVDIWDELAATLHISSSYTAREQHRALETLVLDLARGLPAVTTKQRDIPGIDGGWGGHRKKAIPPQAFAVYVLPDVLEHQEELFKIRFGAEGEQEAGVCGEAEAAGRKRKRAGGDEAGAGIAAQEAPRVAATASKRSRPSAQIYSTAASSQGSSDDESVAELPADKALDLLRQRKAEQLHSNNLNIDPALLAEQTNSSSATSSSAQAQEALANTAAAAEVPTPTPSVLAEATAHANAAVSSDAAIDAPPAPPGGHPAWPGPGSSPPGEGWSTTLQWEDPRQPTDYVVPMRATPRMKKVQRREKENAEAGAATVEAHLKVAYHRHRFSHNLHRRRANSVVLAVLREWQERHRGENNMSGLADNGDIPARSDFAYESRVLRKILANGQDPARLPRHLVPGSKCGATIALAGKQIDDVDVDDLFDEGEMDSYIATEEGRRAYELRWNAEDMEAAHLANMRRVDAGEAKEREKTEREERRAKRAVRTATKPTKRKTRHGEEERSYDVRGLTEILAKMSRGEAPASMLADFLDQSEMGDMERAQLAALSDASDDDMDLSDILRQGTRAATAAANDT